MEETKPVHEIIEEVQAEICDHYCKYTDGYKDAARKKAASKTKKSSFCGYSHEDTDYNAMGLLLMQRQRQKDDHPPELQDSG